MNSHKTASLTIAIGTFFLIATMVLHPVGGDIEHLRKISQMGIIAHSLAIASLPVLFFGLYLFTRKLDSNSAGFALVIFGFAVIAAMIAAALNGLVLPSFLARFQDPSPGELEQIRMILVYNSMVNHAFDWILITGFALSVVFWSFAILSTKYLPTWVSYVGFIDGLLGLWAMFSGSLGLSLHDFRFFMFGFALWILLVSILMWRKTSTDPV